MIPAKHSNCWRLGICQGLGPNQCPDCDGWECEVPCADPPAPTRPLSAYPFAPGVIEGPAHAPMTRAAFIKTVATLVAICFSVGFGLGYLIERFA